jgi:hypothetical protein
LFEREEFLDSGLKLRKFGERNKRLRAFICDRYFPIDRRKQMMNMDRRSRAMLILDPAMLIALAAIISSLSAFVWALRRRP